MGFEKRRPWLTALRDEHSADCVRPSEFPAHFLVWSSIAIVILCCSAFAQTVSTSERAASVTAQWCARGCGLYEVTPGWTIGIGQEDSDLVYQDFQSGRLGILKKKGDASPAFSGGPTLMASSPEVVTFRFIEDSEGRIDRLQLQESGRPLRTATRVDFERVDVTFHNGTTKLAGAIVSRQPSRTRPGIVLIPGGGPQKRDNLQSLWWAYNGFRVLTYDKRGVGRSNGAYREASIQDLAADAASAVSALRSDSLTDKTQVGVVGHSEGGFVAPVLASRVPDVAFVIVLAAPLATMPDQVVHEVASGLNCAGFPEEAIAKAKALRIALNTAVLLNRNWELLRREIEVSEGERWFREARVSREWKTPSKTMIDRTRRYLDFNPADYWKSVKVPVLAMYGEIDTQVQAHESRTMLQQVLPTTKDHQRTIYTYPKANHIFLEAETGCDDEMPTLSRIVPGYYPTLVNWVLRQVRSTP
jgi:pimeloyl-ACP methyl ester carboxylesterase